MGINGSQNEFRSLDKSLRMQKIIDAAVILFHHKGYRSTTLDDVSKKLGITKAALYHYVSSKEHLLSIIYIQALENIFKNTTKICDMDILPDEKMRFLIQNHIKNIIINSISLLSVFFTEENQLSEKDFNKINKEKKKYDKLIENTIEQGISMGLFKKTDPKLTTFGILGMCNWIYKWYKPEHTIYTADEIAENFINLIETGYLSNNQHEQETTLLKNKTSCQKGLSGGKRETLKALRDNCQVLINIVDELESP